jgi:hypothetical protein
MHAVDLDYHGESLRQELSPYASFNDSTTWLELKS